MSRGKRTLSVLVVLALCLGMLPGAARAADLPASFYLSIGGTRVTADSDLDDLLGGGTVSVSYEEVDGQKTWTINLNNANLTDSINATDASLNIVLTGENTITTTQSNHNGITTSWGDITITGGGSLTVDLENAPSNPSAILVSSSASNRPNDVEIDGVTLVLKSNSRAIGTSGMVKISNNSDVTVSSGDAIGYNPAIGGEGIYISGSKVKVTGNAYTEGLNATYTDSNIEIEDSEVEINVPGAAIYTNGDVTITDGSVTAEGGGIGIYTGADLSVSGSEVTAYSQTSNAVYAGYDFSITDGSTATITADGDYPAVYVDSGMFTVSDSELSVNATAGYGIYTMVDMRINGDSTVNAKGYWSAMYIIGGLTVNDGTVSAISENWLGMESYVQLEVNGGEFYAKGTEGYPAVGIYTNEYDEEYATEEYLYPKIVVEDGLVEISGGQIAVSDWHEANDNYGNTYYQYITSFIAADDVTEPDAVLTSPLNEVHIVKEADYSAVDAALAKVPADLSKYTEESVAALQAAIDAVVRNLTIRDQDTVDGFAQAIEEAIANLVVAVTGVTLNRDALTLQMDGTAQLTATVAPEDAGDKTVAWTTGDPAVAVVDENGLVTAKGEGETVITVTTTDGGYEDSCTVTVEKEAPSVVHVTSVALDKHSLSMKTGGTAQLTATVAPENADDKTVTWTTNNPAVAEVDATGLVTAKSAGGAVITVTTTDGGFTDTCTITVEEEEEPLPGVVHVTSVTLNEEVLSLKVSETAQLTATVAPENADDKTVTWTTSDPAVAEVDATGLVTAKSAGGAVITVTTTDGGFTDTCTVTVTAASTPEGPGTPGTPGTPGNPGTPSTPAIPSKPGTETPDQPPAPDEATPSPGDDPGTEEPTHNFTDLGGGDAWYQDAVDYVVSNGIMNGYSETTFGPDENLSRAQLAQILYNMEGLPAVTDGSGFADVSPAAWYASAVAWAAGNSVVSGYGNGLFGPDDDITREQFVMILWRYAGSPAPTGASLGFADAGTASEWAIDALRWAVEQGILNGSNGLLAPQELATRAQAAQMLWRFCEVVKR